MQVSFESLSIKIQLVTSTAEKSLSILVPCSYLLLVRRDFFAPEHINSSFRDTELKACCSPHHVGEREKTLPHLCLMPTLMCPGECTYTHMMVVQLFGCYCMETDFITDVSSVGL